MLLLLFLLTCICDSNGMAAATCGDIPINGMRKWEKKKERGGGGAEEEEEEGGCLPPEGRRKPAIGM